jgi:hypothetical protein
MGKPIRMRISTIRPLLVCWRRLRVIGVFLFYLEPLVEVFHADRDNVQVGIALKTDPLEQILQTPTG